MRIGPWIFAAGLALLCAGVVSTRADAWDTRVPERTVPLQLAGIRTIDIRDAAIREVAIAGKGHPRVHYPGGNDLLRLQDKQASPPGCAASGETLRCTSPTLFLPGTPTMHLPPGRYRLLARNTDIVAQSEVESFVLESDGRIGWKGPAQALQVQLIQPERQPGKAEWHPPPSFSFNGGRVGALRIRAEKGDISLGDLSQVGSIEIFAAPDVSLTVSHVADLARVRVMPLADLAPIGN